MRRKNIIWSDQLASSKHVGITAAAMILTDSLAILIFYKIIELGMTVLPMLAVVAGTIVLIIFLIFNIPFYEQLKQGNKELVLKQEELLFRGRKNNRMHRIRLEDITSIFIIMDPKPIVLIAKSKGQANTAHIIYGNRPDDLPAAKDLYPIEIRVKTAMGLKQALESAGFREHKTVRHDPPGYLIELRR